jgi:thiosulfate dehydrogenase
MNDWSTRVRIANNMFSVCFICVVFGFASLITFMFGPTDETEPQGASGTHMAVKEQTPQPLWEAPDSLDVPPGHEGDLIRYGRELIAHTALYLGPQGSVSHTSNGMNCKNCHLLTGTKPFGNNYSAVAATYPKFRARSGTIESIEKRINDCIQRSLNGKPLASDSREMLAMTAFLIWVGKDVERGKTPQGAGIIEIPLMDLPADPAIGEPLYLQNCSKCHGPNGKGMRTANGKEWIYPPLAGDSSYNIGAGMFRLSKLAGFIKTNMPYGISYENTVLTNEEAWHIAAYVNSLPRPGLDLSKDWPDIKTKPFDHPFGPFADNFSEQQHKYGPFGPIKAAGKAH